MCTGRAFGSKSDGDCYALDANLRLMDRVPPTTGPPVVTRKSATW